MLNWGLLGHEWAVGLLKSHLRTGAPRHAYLFTGPQGVGRRTLALALARAVNCLQPPEPGEFCGECRSCRQFDLLQHPDLSIVQTQEGSRDIAIDQIRELQHTLSLSPYEAKQRIALLLDFEQASRGAANALLKTLEEPPGTVILLLTARSPEALLPTIVSRCEVVRLRPLSMNALAAGLQTHFNVDGEQARLLAHISAGRPGYAAYLHENPELLRQRKDWLDQHQGLLHGSRVERFRFAEKVGKDKEDFQLRLHLWSTYWRDVLLRAAGGQAPIINIDREGEITSLAGKLSPQAARGVVARLESTLGMIRENVNVRLAAEVLLLQMPYI